MFKSYTSALDNLLCLRQIAGEGEVGRFPPLDYMVEIARPYHSCNTCHDQMILSIKSGFKGNRYGATDYGED